MSSLSDDLDLIAEHIGDDQPNLPDGAKNSLLLAAKALRKLPHTVDGVPVVPGMIVSAPGGDGLPHRQATVTAVYAIGEERDDGQYWASVRDSDDNDWIVPVPLCYSTPQAAEEASQS